MPIHREKDSKGPYYQWGIMVQNIIIKQVIKNHEKWHIKKR
jgi:hypothetical protein